MIALRLVALSFAASALAATPSVATAATLAVPGSFSTISAAVAAANPSDVIEVSAGTYNESASILVNDDNLTIRAVGGVVTVTAPSSAENVFDIQAVGVTLEGLTIARPTADTDWRRTVQVGAGTLTLTNCIIEGPGNSVGVILFNGTDLTATGTTFRNFNGAGSWAAAIFMEGNAGSPTDYTNVSLDNCTFGADCSGWIKAFDGAPPKIGNITVSNTVFNAAANPQAIRFGGNTTYDLTGNILFEDCEFTGTNLEVAEFHYTPNGRPVALTFRRCQFNAYNSNRRAMYLDIPCDINFENVVWKGGQHETLLRFWGGPANVSFQHCTLINDGITGATSASGNAGSTLIDGYDGGGRTFTLRNSLLYAGSNHTAALVGDAGSAANRAYDIDWTIIQAGTASSGPVTITAGANYSNATILFSNPGGRDYELQPASPGVNSGTDLGITQDVLKRPRVVGGAPDYGAYENQTVSSVDEWSIM